MTAQLQQVRSFNRIVAQRAGALDDSYLGQGRPLGEARLLFEVGEGADMRQLRDRLSLDSGYASRLLRALEKQALVRTSPAPEDGRVRRVHLTDKGRAEVEAYDRLSDERARDILAPFSDTQRARLTAAMAEVERLLRLADLHIEVIAPDSLEARACVAAYVRELAALFDTGYDPDVAGPNDEDEYAAPNGLFVVARLDGKAIGCGGLKRLDAETGEIKRLWASPNTRGLGIGRKVLHRLEALAREAGLRRLCLDTNGVLTTAQSLYHAEGYIEVAPYNDNPYATHWFAKDL